MTLEALFKSTTEAARSLRVRSALNPMLWLTLIVSVVFLTAAFILQADAAIEYVCVGVAVLTVLVTLGGFIYFALKSPEKLQSEDYQLRHETLQFLQTKSGPVVLQPASVNALTNPMLPRIPGEAEVDA